MVSCQWGVVGVRVDRGRDFFVVLNFAARIRLHGTLRIYNSGIVFLCCTRLAFARLTRSQRRWCSLGRVVAVGSGLNENVPSASGRTIHF